VLVGHNEQNGGLRILNFRRVPGQSFPPDAVVRLRRGGELPQIGRAWSFLWSEIPGQEFSDAYLNEHGVAIVSDACPTREDDYDTLVARGEICHGGIGYMLRRLVAQRARTARDGVELAGRLIERLGYVDSGRTYVIADPHEAWLLAVVRGRHWVARRVPDDAVVLLPNVHIIGAVDLSDTKNYLASPGLIDYAVARGWYDPDAGKPFSFRKAYNRNPADPPDPRRWHARQLIGGNGEAWPPKSPPPPGIRPSEKMTVATVARILRDTTGEGRTISTPVTQEGAVFQLRTGMPAEIGCIYWRTTAEPSTSVLLPWYLGITATPPSFYRPLDLPTHLSLEHHFNPPPRTFEPTPRSAWWTFKTLQDRVREDFSQRSKVVRTRWDAFERDTFARQAKIEKEALALWQTNRTAARAFLTQCSSQFAAKAIREAEKLTVRFSDPGRLRN